MQKRKRYTRNACLYQKSIYKEKILKQNVGWCTTDVETYGDQLEGHFSHKFHFNANGVSELRKTKRNSKQNKMRRIEIFEVEQRFGTWEQNGGK